MDRLPRRHFLKVLAASAAMPPFVSAVSACSSSATAPETFGDVAGGTVASLPVGSLNVVNGVSAAIGRDAKGVYAMTLTCTHQGCDIATRGSVSPAGISCACHGSTFDANGNVTGGPASGPLAHFAVSVDAAGNLTVHGSQQVDSATRLSV
jgi:nitrite reductase/ring-hydroxylating ferredoxin subunit